MPPWRDDCGLEPTHDDAEREERIAIARRRRAFGEMIVELQEAADNAAEAEAA